MTKYPGYDVFTEEMEQPLKELGEAYANDSIIECEIINANNGGYLVDYKGYPCFLPYSVTTHKFEPEIDFVNFLNSIQKLKIKDVKNKTIIVSRKAYLNTVYDKLEQEELSKLNVGDTFTGIVRKVESYGVFIFKEHSIGLLHINDILNIDFDKLSNESKVSLKNILREVFPKKTSINVIIKSISEGKYKLYMDTNDKDTNLFISKINDLIYTNSAYQKLKEELESQKKNN